MRDLGLAIAKGSPIAGEKVPVLEEILDFAKQNDVIFYLEIKSGQAWGIEHVVVATLRDLTMRARE